MNLTLTSIRVASDSTETISAYSDSASATNMTAPSVGLTVQAPTITSVSISPASVYGGAKATGTIKFSSACPASFPVTLSSASATATVATSVTPADKAVSVTFPITTIAVTADELIAISATANSVTASANFTVATPTLKSLTVTSPVKGGANSTATVGINGIAPAGGITISLTSSDGNVAGGDALIAEGKVSGTFLLKTTSAASDYKADITAIRGLVTKTATVSVSAPTVKALTISPGSVLSGKPATGTVTITSVAPVGGLVVSLASDNSCADPGSSATVPEGMLSTSFAIATSGVSGSTTAKITASYGASNAVANIVVTAAALSGITFNPMTLIGGDVTTGTVTISGIAPAGGAVVSLSSSFPDALNPSATVTIPEGATSVDFTVTTSPVAADTSAVVTATYGGISKTRAVTVRVSEIDYLNLSPGTVTGGAAATGSVYLKFPAGPGGFLVQVRSANQAAAKVPTSALVPAGENHVDFAIITLVQTVTSDVVITASDARAKGTATLTVRKPNSGTFKWTFATGGTVYSSAAVGPTGIVYSASYNGKLHAINPDGTQKFEFIGGQFYARPTLGNGVLYAPSLDGYVYAINTSNFSLRWKFKDYSNDAFYGRALVAADGTVFALSSNGHLVSINPATHKENWRLEFSAQAFDCLALGPDGMLYCGDYTGAFRCINPANGNVRWAINFTGVNLRVAPDFGSDGTVYVGTDGGLMYAINCIDGTTKWTYDTGDYIYGGTKVAPDGTIYFGINGQRLVALNNDGTLKWKSASYGPIYATPQLSNDGSVVYVATIYGHLHAYNAVTGQFLWDASGFGDAPQGQPIIGADGTIYLTSPSGKVFALYP